MLEGVSSWSSKEFKRVSAIYNFHCYQLKLSLSAMLVIMAIHDHHESIKIHFTESYTFNPQNPTCHIPGLLQTVWSILFAISCTASQK